jgi:hypothetical protein
VKSRFVILHHKIDRGEHWDLMIEDGPVLLTWQLTKEPARLDDFPIAARRIGDHRKAYLVYEGPISGDRGNVTRVDEGEAEFQERSAVLYCVRLRGRRWAGTVSLPGQSTGEARLWQRV